MLGVLFVGSVDHFSIALEALDDFLWNMDSEVCKVFDYRKCLSDSEIDYHRILEAELYLLVEKYDICPVSGRYRHEVEDELIYTTDHFPARDSMFFPCVCESCTEVDKHQNKESLDNQVPSSDCILHCDEKRGDEYLECSVGEYFG